MRGLAAAICLLPPTLLMGATLPAISRWVESTPEGVSWLGFFYGGNIGGGVLGSLLAGFYLLRVYDLAVATFVAVALNVTVALLAIAIAKATPVPERLASDRESRRRAPVPGAWAVYLAIALSGATALVVRSDLDAPAVAAVRRHRLHLLADPRACSCSASASAAASARRSAAPARARASSSAGARCSCARRSRGPAYMLTESMPYWPINPSITDRSVVQLPARFRPLPVGRAAGRDPVGRELSARPRVARVARPGSGRLVGGVYAANTIGAIVGSLCASLLLVVWLGSQHAQQVLILISALSGLLVLSTGGAEEPARAHGGSSSPAR